MVREDTHPPFCYADLKDFTHIFFLKSLSDFGPFEPFFKKTGYAKPFDFCENAMYEIPKGRDFRKQLSPTGS